MIKSFKGKIAKELFQRVPCKRFSHKLNKAALRRLLMIHVASTLEDLKSPPGNRLEQLKGNRKGMFSIRINEQWRICFSWKDGNAYNVEICDYH